VDTLVLLIYLIAILTVGIYSYILFFLIVNFGGGIMMSEVAVMTPRAIGLYYVKIVKTLNVFKGNKYFTNEVAVIFCYAVIILSSYPGLFIVIAAKVVDKL
jgi:hypothetical protein